MSRGNDFRPLATCHSKRHLDLAWRSVQVPMRCCSEHDGFIDLLHHCTLCDSFVHDGTDRISSCQVSLTVGIQWKHFANVLCRFQDDDDDDAQESS